MSTDFEDRLRAARDSLPKPDSTISASVERRLLASLPATHDPRRRAQIQGRVLAAAVAFALALGALGFGIGRWVGPSSGRAATATPQAAPGFIPAQGWNTISTGLTKPPQAPTALAANVPFAAKDGESVWAGNFPGTTINGLPSNGVVLAVWLYGGQPLKNYPQRTQPFQLSDAIQGHGFEGVSRQKADYTILARTPGWNVQVEVFFGAGQPSSQQLQLAQAELNRLVLPG